MAIVSLENASVMTSISSMQSLQVKQIVGYYGPAMVLVPHMDP